MNSFFYEETGEDAIGESIEDIPESVARGMGFKFSENSRCRAPEFGPEGRRILGERISSYEMKRFIFK